MLSLAFVLAFIGAAVGLLIGIVIFGEVSEAIECPASGGGGGGGGVLFDTTGAASDGAVTLAGNPTDWVGQLVSTSGESISSVTVNNMDNSPNFASGTIVAEIWTGATTDIDTATLVGNSSNSLAIVTNSADIDFTWTFTPPVTVNNPNTFISLHGISFDSDMDILTSSSDIGLGIILVHDGPTNSGFYTPVGFADMLMRVDTSGGSPGQTGSEQCQQAKDTAWTVIGIMPVALFFALFSIFGALGKTD